MNKKNIIELIGITALVVSLVFVAWELRQSNRIAIAIATAEAELRTGNREFNSIVAENPGLAAILVKAREAGARLDPIEDEIHRSYARTGFNLLTQANAEYENGLLSNYTIDVYKNFIIRNFNQNSMWVQYYAENVREYNLHRVDSELWIFLVSELENRGVEF